MARTSTADTYFARGLQALSQGNYVEAQVAHRQAIELKADFVEAHFNLGVALTQQGRSLA